jgi:poly-gamma-glutamate capsule biosynthesis protein CapA/YwtB (metallophosphatase superfamily)
MRISIIVAASICFLILCFYFTRDNAFAIESSMLSITAVGDTTGNKIKKENLSSALSSEVGNIIKSSDLFIFNLEAVLVGSKENVQKCEGFSYEQSVFVSNSTFADYLKLAPITIANLANNHILECNSEGIKETKRVLTEKGIYFVGAGQNLQEACEPLFIKYNGLDIAFVSYNFVLPHLVSADPNRPGAASLSVCNHDYGNFRLKKGVDLIVASIHLGLWSPDVNKEQVKVVDYLIKSGVDIVIGHSPHMPQAMLATEEGKLAFFSLGNFIFRPDYEMPSLAHTTIVPKINLYKDNRMDITIYPVRIDSGGVPHIEKNTNDIISRIAEGSKMFNTSIKIQNNLGYISTKSNITEIEKIVLSIHNSSI